MQEKSLERIMQGVVPFNEFSLAESEYSFEFIDKCFLFIVLMSIAIAEKNVNNDQEEYSYRSIDDRLDKHRKSTTYDGDIQKLLLSLKNIVTYNCTIEKCGNSEHYKTKMKCKFRDFVCFVFHTYSKEAKYLQEYYKMNNNIIDAKFAFLQFKTDKDNKKINQITFNIPDTNGNIETKIDLSKEYIIVKSYINQIENQVEYLQRINRIISYDTNELTEENEEEK